MINTSPITSSRAPLVNSAGPTDHPILASAGINIALIKYWGKRLQAENIPSVGSLSLTLEPWGSETRVLWRPRREAEEGASHFVLNGVEIADGKVDRLLTYIRNLSGLDAHYIADVQSENSVPTASGLASSASGMAALGVASWIASGLPLTPTNPRSSVEGDDLFLDGSALPQLLVDGVRIGSGSAPRSLLGGLVRLESDGRTLSRLCTQDAWPLALVVAVVSRGPKETSSREGMERTRLTSPYHAAWIESHTADLDAATEAIKRRDLSSLGELMEHSTFKMHASMWASRPPLRYLKGVSLDLLDRVAQLRSDGVSAWATMDAGPHVKVLCPPESAPQVVTALRAIPGVLDTLTLKPGSGVRFKRQIEQG